MLRHEPGKFEVPDCEKTYVVSQMGTSCGDAFSVFQATDVLPIDFVVTEWGPTVALALLKEFLHSSPNWGSEQQNPSDGVVELDWLFGILETLDKISSLPVSSILGVVLTSWWQVVRNISSSGTRFGCREAYSVEVADSICDFKITIPSQVALDWLFTGSVSLLVHGGIIGIDGVLAGLGRCSKNWSKIDHMSLACGFSYELGRWSSQECVRRV